MSTVLIADDHPVWTKGLADVINAIPGFRVVDSYTDGEELLDYLATEPIDWVFLDLHMEPGDGAQLARRIRDKYPLTQVVIISGEENDLALLEAARDAGIVGYIGKRASPAEIREALTTMQQGKTYFSRSVLERLAQVNSPVAEVAPPLTKQEYKVLTALHRGRKRSEIASDLGTGTGAYDTHYYHLKQKFRVTSLIELIRKAVRLKVLPTEPES